MKSSLAISVLIHVALVLGAVLLLGGSVMQERDVFFVELESITVTPPSKGISSSAPVSKPKASPPKPAESRPEQKQVDVKEPVREVKKQEDITQPSVTREEPDEPALSQASYMVESPGEEPAGGAETSGAAYSSAEEAVQGEDSAGQGGEGDAPSSGAEVSRDALLLQIRDAIQRELTYPPLARRRKLEGTVVAGFVIDGGGRPRDIEIVRSSGFSILDNEVVEIIRRASPYPYVPERVEVPVSFKLLTGR